MSKLLLGVPSMYEPNVLATNPGVCAVVLNWYLVCDKHYNRRVNAPKIERELRLSVFLLL